jgi:hypothetical protein
MGSLSFLHLLALYYHLQRKEVQRKAVHRREVQREEVQQKEDI